MEATTYYLTFIISAILDDNLSSGILPSIVYALTGTGFFTIVGRFYLTKLHDKLGMDFHDQFGSQLVRIIALTNTLSFGEQTELERSRMVTKIGKIAQELYQESKEFMWTVNPENLNLASIGLKVSQLGQDLFNQSGMKFTYLNMAEGEMNNFEPESTRQIISILKEALVNAYKHSSANEVYFKIEAGQYNVTFFVSDNGRGFQPSVGGSGLTNMKHRAETLGGHISFRSDNTGTEVELSVNLKDVINESGD